MRLVVVAVKSLLGLLVICCVMIALHPPVLAHVEQSNNGVSAVMHIYPDDNPIAGRNTSIGFAFGGQYRAFTVTACACTLTVNNGVSDTTIVPIQSAGKDALSGLATVKFPKAGVYNLSASGLTGNGQGSTFRLDYTVRVNPGTYTSNAAAAARINALLISATTIIILGMAAEHNIVRGGRYSHGKKRSKSDDPDVL